jgi:secreted trypsin-like serine protease
LHTKRKHLGDIDLQLNFRPHQEKEVEFDITIQMHTATETPSGHVGSAKHNQKPSNKANKIKPITSDEPQRTNTIWIERPQSENQTEVDEFLNSAVCPNNWTAPWQVGLLLLTKDYNERKCGGVLIHKRWVLTAAHCVDNTIASLYVMLGHSKYTDGFLKKGQVIEVERSIIHEDYRPATESQPPLHDIALLKLGDDAQLDDDISVARLPQRNNSFLAPDTEMIIAGWGYTETNLGSQEDLRCARVPLVSLQKCQRDYKENNINGITKDHLCTGYLNGVAEPCNGDSGGGLVHVGSDGNSTVVGIISWTEQCGQGYHVCPH